MPPCIHVHHYVICFVENMGCTQTLRSAFLGTFEIFITIGIVSLHIIFCFSKSFPLVSEFDI